MPIGGRGLWLTAGMSAAVAIGLGVLRPVRGEGESPGVVVPTTYHLHHDLFGSVVAKTDANGSVVWRATPAPFGVETNTTAAHKARFLGNPKLHKIAPEGGAYQLGARTYFPYLGRFSTPDPLRTNEVPGKNPQNFNRYVYGLNNPYKYVDPSGLISEQAQATVQQIVRVASQSPLLRYIVGFSNSDGNDLVTFNGTARNISFSVSGRENKEFFFCNGIAEVAQSVIGLALAEGKLSGVASFGTIERKNEGWFDRNVNFLKPDHTAFYVKLATGEEVVLDWHATLNTLSPKVTSKDSFCSGYDVCSASGKDAATADSKVAKNALNAREEIIKKSDKEYTGK